MITIKNEKEIKIMRQAGKKLALVMQKIAPLVKRGVFAFKLDQVAENLIKEQGCKPAFKGYRGYPATLCVSLNQEVVHGIPKKNKIIQDKDLVKLDCGLIFQGYYADMAITIAVGDISQEAQKLIEVTKKSLDRAIEVIKPGLYLGDISAVIQKTVEENNFSVVRDLTGHGIGKKLHEDPTIFNYGLSGTGPILKPGMTFCFEPMVNVGGWRVKVLDDKWTIISADNSLSAHFEHMVLVTENGAEVLTKI